MTDTDPIPVPELARRLEDALRLDDAGTPQRPMLTVDLDAPAGSDAGIAETARRIRESALVVVGFARRPVAERLTALTAACTLTLVEHTDGPPARRCEVRVPDLDAALATVADAVAGAPAASMTLAGLLKLTAQLPVGDALAAESSAYSTLLAGAEFGRWLAGRARRTPPAPADPAVLVSRRGADLYVTINRPARHNAYSRDVRDGLVAAFELARLDPEIARILLTGAGESFCSGGDLDEFGTTTDVSVAHLIRLDRSVAARVHACRGRVEVRLHGACIGAGIEIPSFAGRVVARPDTVIRLPELAMGLVPGAGGTVGITARIGRWRTAYLALTGLPVATDVAEMWGLVDAVEG